MHRFPSTFGFVGLVAALCLVIGMAPRASAQAGNPRAELFGGISVLGGDRTFVIGSSLFETSYANGGKFGLRGTVDLDDHWAAEAAYSFGTNDLRVTDLTLIQQREFDVRLHQFTGSALYFISTPESMIRPFGTVGLGISRFSVTGGSKLRAAGQFLEQGAAIRDENKFAFHFGGGVEAKPWDRFGVRLDLRDFVTGVPRYGLPELSASPGAAFYPVSGIMNRFEISAGVVFFFGQ